jgi:two-component system, NarL family, sensor kinase
VSGLVKAMRSPVTLMLVTGLIALVSIVVVTGELGRRAASEQALARARATTMVLAHSVAEPAIPRGLIDLDQGAQDRFDPIRSRLLVQNVKRVKIWRADGTIVYSDFTDLIKRKFLLGEDEREIFEHGGTEAEVSDLNAPENRLEPAEARKEGRVEVYTRIRSPEKEPLLFEVYYSTEALDRTRAEILSSFRPITLAAMGLVLLVGTALLYALTRRLRRSAEERQRLLEAAVEASEAERVRIARDLHDGVVQDLVGASFAMSALARTDDLPEPARQSADEAGSTVRSSLKALRSLMVEIYPPDLRAEGLGAALQDLLAPAAAHGVAASATVQDAEPASDAAVGLVWRVAQEAVRNSLRHSGAQTLGVAVSGVQRAGDKRLVLTVTDDGAGFDPSAPRPAGHFGLRGLAGLVKDAGGRLDVKSSVGEGTTVHLEIPAGAR